MMAIRTSNKQIAAALRALSPAARKNLLAWVEWRDKELRQQLVGELEQMILQGQPPAVGFRQQAERGWQCQKP